MPENEDYKEIRIYKPAYVHMVVDKDGGYFFIDDYTGGWFWDGDYDEFLLGLLRVSSSTLFDKFLKELREENITKEDIKRAIRKSLERDPADGLYAVLGDNANYLDFNDNSGWAYSNIEHEMRNCLQNNVGSDEVAGELAEAVVDELAIHTPSTKDIFTDIENELRDSLSNVGVNKSWKEFVNEAIEKCDEKHDDVEDFVKCIIDEIDDIENDAREYFMISLDGEYKKALKDNKKEIIKALKENKGIKDDKILENIERCIEWV